MTSAGAVGWVKRARGRFIFFGRGGTACPPPTFLAFMNDTTPRNWAFVPDEKPPPRQITPAEWYGQMNEILRLQRELDEQRALLAASVASRDALIRSLARHIDRLEERGG